MTNADDLSWLELPTLPAAAAVKASPQYQRAVEVMNKLTPKQTLYLDTLFDCGMDPRRALRQLKKRHGLELTRKVVEQEWLQGDPTFAEAVRTLQEFAISSIALSKAGLLGKLVKLIDDTRRIVHFADKQGNTYERPVDAGAAISGISLAAKLTGALAESSDRPPPVRQLPSIIIQLTAPATVRNIDAVEGELINKEQR